MTIRPDDSLEAWKNELVAHGAIGVRLRCFAMQGEDDEWRMQIPAGFWDSMEEPVRYWYIAELRASLAEQVKLRYRLGVDTRSIVCDVYDERQASG